MKHFPESDLKAVDVHFMAECILHPLSPSLRRLCTRMGGCICLFVFVGISLVPVGPLRGSVGDVSRTTPKVHKLKVHKSWGVGCKTQGFEMQIEKQWQHWAKCIVKECVFSQQG